MIVNTRQQNYNSYRPDIDGLRAIAVVAVIIFHINSAILPGGFAGVDIFFVISGYLITLHIFRDLEKERFSLLEFYRRRVKRIAPAMLVVVFFTIVVAQFILRPVDAENVAESGLWSLLSVANVYFWLYQDTSYFAAASNELPLLHLWSLGVEEQFYIFWPLLLLLGSRIGHGRYFFLAFALLAAGSFVLGEYLFKYDPLFVYYMLPTRAGELLAGALIAHIIFKRGALRIPGVVVAAIALAGLVLTAASLILLSEDMVFPGFSAMLPTAGAALLILAGHYGNSWPSRLLVLKPMIWMGLISYSAYLWHWPLLAFFRYGQLQMTLATALVIFAITILIAWLSYLYIETPARKMRSSALQVFTQQYLIPGGIIAFIALLAVRFDGYGWRWLTEDYKSDLASLRGETRPAYDYDYVCQTSLLKEEDVTNVQCVLGDGSRLPPKALLWGDSNAAHYVGMIGAFAEHAGFAFRNVQISSCPPIDADPEAFVVAKRVADCRASRGIAIATLDDYQVVIIAANWTGYQSRSDKFLGVLYETARDLVKKGKLVILIGKAPVIPTYDRLCDEKSLSFPGMNCNLPVPMAAGIAAINQQLRDFAMSNKNIEYYDITSYLCPAGICSAFDSTGRPLYYNSTHLALPASRVIGNEIYKRDGVPYPFSLISGWSPTVSPGQ